MHKQKWAKVNAPVDVGVADLVEALSRFPKLRTIESCQGSKGHPAFVFFEWGIGTEHPWRELAQFAFEKLGPALHAALGCQADIELFLAAPGRIQAKLSVRHGLVYLAAEAINKLANGAN